MTGETNQVKWRGVRPVAGIDGIWPATGATRILKDNSQLGVGTAIVYTVPADTKLYLSGASLSSRQAVQDAATAGLGIRTAGDVHVNWLLYHWYYRIAEQCQSMAYLPAVGIPAGYDVYVNSDHANVAVRGIIRGWLEDVGGGI